MSERRVLFITYHVPPVAGVGVERTLKHVTYLPDAGWRPVVVGPGNPGYRLVDRYSEARIPPGTEVHRAFSVEPAHVRQLFRRLALASRAARPDAERAVESSPAAHGGADSSHQGRLRRRGVRGALNLAWSWLIPRLFFPDEQLLWIPSAAAVALNVHRTDPVDAIYSSSPPVSGHLAAALVKRVTGLPWIADFRDPWIGNAFSPPLPPPQEALRRELERLIVHGADRTVLATDALRDTYARRYPDVAHRISSITNGYDLPELAGLAEGHTRGPHRPFRLRYAGSVYGDTELVVFLDGLARLVADRPSVRDELRVEFIGWFNARNERVAAERLPALAPIVQHSPQLPRHDALARLADADAGLILLAGGAAQASILTAKLFDYLGLDLPVLAIAPSGELRRVLAELEWGVAADPTPEGVASGIAAIMESVPPSRHADPERRFERRRLSAQLASLLDEVAPRRFA